MRQLTDSRQVDELLEKRSAIFFKHSTRCPLSAAAYREVETFQKANPNMLLYVIHVIEERSLSQYVEQKTGVPHQSPQIIVLRQGGVVWQASHFEITSDALTEQVGYL